MTKKQWVAPSAQLVQFAANEYVAACSNWWSAKIVNAVVDSKREPLLPFVGNTFAFIDKDGDNELDFNGTADLNPGNSWELGMKPDSEGKLDGAFNTVVTEPKGYDLALEDYRTANKSQYWLYSGTDFWISKDTVTYKGFYATKETTRVSNVHKADIWFDSEKGGYYVASLTDASRSA